MNADETGARGNRRAAVLWIRLARFVHSQGAPLSEHLRAWELNPAQFDVLAQVGSSDGLTQRELARRLVVTEGNVTQILDKMEHCGILARAAEGRCNRLSLTERGRTLYKSVVPAHEQQLERVFGRLTREEQDELSRLLRKLQRGTE